MAETETEPDKDAMIAALQEAYDVEATSLLTYLLEVSNPHSNTKDRAIGELLHRMAEEERQDREAVADLISDLGGFPESSTFDMDNAHYNYLSSRYLLDLVLTRLLEQRAMFERVAAKVAAEPRAAELLRTIAGRRAKSAEALQAALDAAKKAAAPPPPKAVPAVTPTAAAAKPAAAVPKPATAAKPPLDPEKLAALKAAAEAKKAALAAGTAGAEKPPA